MIACVGFSRAGAGVLAFSKQTEDLLARIAGCLQRLGVYRQAGIHGHAGRPTGAFAAFCGQLRVGWRLQLALRARLVCSKGVSFRPRRHRARFRSALTPRVPPEPKT